MALHLDPQGYVDLQLNGYAGIDFNGPRLHEDALQQVCERLVADGVRIFLPTLITAPVEEMCQRAKRIMELRAKSELARHMIPGLHFEGPFLNSQPGYIGAHPVHAACDANLDVMQRLMDAAEGKVCLVTLAPERDVDAQVTRWLAGKGIVVSAGHSNATALELARAIDAGLSMYTHLGNGCPALLHRHDNIIQRVLHFAERLWISFIADGHHVPVIALGNYLKLCDPKKTIVVTDAIAAAGLGPGIYQLGSLQVEVTEDGAAWAPGRTHFAGAAVTMPQSFSVLTAKLGLSETHARELLCVNPARLIAQ